MFVVVSHVESAIIGPLCNIGEEAKINIGVRVWPKKKIESGTFQPLNTQRQAGKPLAAAVTATITITIVGELLRL